MSKRSKRISYCIIFFIALSVKGYGQEKNLSIEQAIDLALKHNAQLKNSNLATEAQKYEVKSVIASGLPQINLNGTFTHNIEIPSAVFPDFITPSIYQVLIDENVIDKNRFKSGEGGQAVQFGAPSQIAGTIGLSQLVFDGRYFLGLKAAKQVVKMNELLAKQTEIETKELTWQSYYQVFLLEENLTLLKKSGELVNALLLQTEAMHQEGMVEKLDVDRLLLSQKNIENKIVSLENQLIVSKMALNMAMGQEIEKSYHLTSGWNKNVTDINVENTFSQSDRIEQKILNQSMLLKEMETKGMRVTKYPSLYFNAQHLQNSFTSQSPFEDLGKDWFPGTLYSLSLNIPLFDGFYKRNKIQKLKVEAQQIDNDKKNLEYLLRMNHQSSLLGLKTQFQSLGYLASTLELAQRIFETEKIKFNEGMGSSFELVNAQNDFIQASLQHSNGQYELIIKNIAYLKSIGKL